MSLFNSIQRITSQWLTCNTVMRRYATVANRTALNGNSVNQRLESPAVIPDTDWVDAKPYEEIPGPRSLPVLGTSWIMLPFIGAGIPLSREFHLLKIHHERYGSIWKESIPMLFPQLVSTANPADAEKVFRADGRLPNRPGFESLGAYRAQRVKNSSIGGTLVDNGELWWDLRSKAQQPFLKLKNVYNYAPVLAQIADEFIDRIRLIRRENNEVPENFVNEMHRWALESVAVVGLNKRLGCLDANLSPDSDPQKFIDASTYALQALFEIESSFPLWKFIKTPKFKKMFQALDVISDMSVNYITKSMEDIKHKKNDSPTDELSILEQFFVRGMSLEETIVMVSDMLVAGIDTTAHSTAFLLYFLARNPDKQEKLRNEIFKVVGKKGNNMTTQNLNELHYLKSCLKETLRLIPAASGNLRVIGKDLVLSGYRVPKGTVVRMLHQITSHSEEHFPDALKFIPERWIKGDPQESNHHPYAVLPFGFGTRMCIGRRLAELEMFQLVTKILQNYKVEYHHQDISWLTRSTNTPDQPLRFKFIDV